MIDVTAAIIEKQGLLLITRRSVDKHLGGMWEFPGGKLELNESLEECLEREIKEELGIKIQVMKLLAVNDYRYEKGSIRLHAFRANFVEGEITLKDHDEYQWTPKTELDKYEFAPADIPFVNMLKE